MDQDLCTCGHPHDRIKCSACRCEAFELAEPDDHCRATWADQRFCANHNGAALDGDGLCEAGRAFAQAWAKAS
jgi:hypothetical protein